MKERRNFSKAFKIEAVRLLSLEEKPATQLARELDIGCNLLYKWRDLLAVLLDLHSRRVVGWAMANRVTQELTHAALQMAIEQRRPGPGLMHHSDQGGQYTAKDYQDRLTALKITASMSRKGNPHDNAVVESFFSNLKNELTHHRNFTNQNQARSEIFDYIEIFYNRQRAHATLQYVSPVIYEELSNGAQLNCPENPG